MRHTRIAPAAVLLLALAAGCSSSHDSAKDEGGGAKPPGISGVSAAAPAPAPLSPSPTPSATPAPISEWPKKVSPVAAAPRLIQHQAMRPGYTGDAYIRKIAAKWHITMPKKSDPSSAAPRKDPVLSSAGTAHPAHGTELTLDAVWNRKGELMLIQCNATASAPQAREFLRDCTHPDYPGAKLTGTAAWLDATEHELDEAHKDGGTVVSPARRTGATAEFMSEWTDATYGDTYTAEIIGVP